MLKLLNSWLAQYIYQDHFSGVADPLNVTASIIAVLQLTTTMVRCTSGVRTILDDVRTLQEELLIISGILFSLRDIDTRPSLGDLCWTLHLRKVIRNSSKLCNHMHLRDDIVDKCSFISCLVASTLSYFKTRVLARTELS